MALLIGVGLLLGNGCSYGPSAAVPARTAAAAFEPGPCPPTHEPDPAYDKARCGYLVVPENRADPNGRTIRLAVAIVPAASPHPAPDPVVYLSGGPGEDPIPSAKVLIEAGLNRDRQLILLSQRGESSSQPTLTCADLDEFRARSVGLAYDSSATKRQHLDAATACRRKLAVGGTDLSAYNTIENAADVADLRTALGIDQWNVYGASYGTDLALTLMREHPQGIRAVVIDGIVPPDAATLSGFWRSAREGFDGVFRACEAEAACRDHYPDLRATFTELVRKLEANPVETSVKLPTSETPVKVVLDGGALVNWMVRLISNGQDGSEAPYAIDQLAKDHPETVARQWASYWVAPEFYGKFSYGLNYGVICSEWVRYEEPSQLLARGRAEFPDYPDSVLAQGPQIPFMNEDCRIWNVPKAPASVRRPTQSAIPTLVISGGFDAKTGAQWGDHAARTLPRSKVITIPGMGHGAGIFAPCGHQVVASFLRTPTAPDTSCVATLSPKPFKTP
ncbi:alpha/beta fold hydrolase [Streptomyces sp. NPDC057686]|uniref:alpha/beta fold hydrolase n=1 Tax=Streptomyces sp. NPDC057686 TaxID=3346212 RepID=UPI0036BEE35A